MGLFSGITKLAKKVTGVTTGFKKILDLKPSLTGLLLPPQVQMGLKVAKFAGGVLNIDVPDESEIRDYAEGRIGSALEGVKRSGIVGDIIGNLEKAEQFATKVEEFNGKLVTVSSKRLEGKELEEILQSIDWLL